MADDRSNLALIRVLAAVAWADGIVEPEEEALLRSLARELGLGDGESAELESLLREPVSIDRFETLASELHRAAASPAERARLVDLMEQMAAADHRTAPEEAALLRRLRTWLEEAPASASSQDPAGTVEGSDAVDNGIGGGSEAANAGTAGWARLLQGMWGGVRAKAIDALSAASSAAGIAEPVRAKGGPLSRLDPLRRHFLALFGALILRVAYADGEVRDEEIETLRRVLADESGFPPEEVESLVELVEARAGSGADRQRLCAEYNRIAAMPQRLRLLECLFTLGYADGELSPAEEREIRLISNYLWIETQEFVRIRAEARDRQGRRGTGTGR